MINKNALNLITLIISPNFPTLMKIRESDFKFRSENERLYN